jgi:hypothetical protein
MINCGGSAPQRRAHRVHRIHRITSAVHFDLRYIFTAGAVGGWWRGRRRPSLFLLYNSYVREIYDNNASGFSI